MKPPPSRAGRMNRPATATANQRMLTLYDMSAEPRQSDPPLELRSDLYRSHERGSTLWLCG